MQVEDLIKEKSSTIDRSNWSAIALNVLNKTIEIPRSYTTPWLVTYCLENDAIRHFNFTFRNL